MKFRLLLPLLSLAFTPPGMAQGLAAANGGAPLAGQSPTLTAAPDPDLNWRDPQWLSRQRERSRWRYQRAWSSSCARPCNWARRRPCARRCGRG